MGRGGWKGRSIGEAFHSAATMASSHIDMDALLEDYAWRHFRDIQSLRKTRLEDFKGLEREDVEFSLNKKHLVVQHDDPDYRQLHATGAKPFTLFKSIYTNNTDRPQEYSFKTERTTESVVSVCREQGWAFGIETELTLKTPCEVAELKAGFKHEMHFNSLNENCHSESLSWGVDSSVVVPAHYTTEAAIIIEEINYQGSYSVTSRISGSVTISLRRRKDGLLVMPLTVNVVEVLREQLENPGRKDLKAMMSIQGKEARLVSKGTCHFQFAMKQKIELKEEATTLEKEKMMID